MNVKNIFCALVASVLLTATYAFALSLAEAKRQGLVGEAHSGYLAPVSAPSSEVNALIQQVNSQRREKYNQIAQKNGTSLPAVEALAGKKAIEETAGGNFVQGPGGAWRRK